jgi:hypothetical protein
VVKVNLRGVAKARSKGRTYYYAWRGGPRLTGEPGSAEFVASYVEAHENLRKPEPGRFKALVVAYRTSSEFKNLVDSTRVEYARWLDRIVEYFWFYASPSSAG